MGRRRSASDDSSLDLLLDTITNTLGGILFLAILLVLLTKASKALVVEDRHAPPTESNVVLDQIEAAESELINLQKELTLSTAMLEQLGDASRQRLGSEIAEKRAEIRDLTAERDRLTQALTERQQRSVTAGQAKAEVLTQVEAKQERLTKLLSQLQDEIVARSEDLPLPRERGAKRIPFGIVVRYGRLYFDRKSHPRDTDEPNLEDFIDLGTEAGGGASPRFRVVTPKPWKGEVILGTGGLTAGTQRSLLAWKPNRYYATVSVWDDSFAEMRALRQFFVGNGYQYRLIPVTDGDEIVETAVPNPQVQ